MVFQDERQRVPIWFPLGIIPIALFLLGCAESSPATSHGPDLDQHVVVGQGTAEDRDAINASNQKIFDTERGGSPITATAPPAPSQLQDGNSQ